MTGHLVGRGSTKGRSFPTRSGNGGGAPRGPAWANFRGAGGGEAWSCSGVRGNFQTTEKRALKYSELEVHPQNGPEQGEEGCSTRR